MYTINKIPIRDKSADFKVLEKSSEFLFEKLKIDENNPDLYDQFSLRVDQSGGHRYFVDYRYLFGQMFEDNEFISFPDKINDLLEAVEVSSLMGLLPEINRAYITIDNKLYLWNYNNSNELEVFDGLSEISNYNDSNIISRLWKSLIYRIIPSDSNITIGKRFLSTKRNADVIDIDENRLLDIIFDYLS
eukprot:gene19909-25864_t